MVQKSGPLINNTVDPVLSGSPRISTKVSHWVTPSAFKVFSATANLM